MIQITERTPSEKRAYADGLNAAISMLEADFRRCMHKDAAMIARDMDAAFQKMRMIQSLNDRVLTTGGRESPPPIMVSEEACAAILADPVAVRELMRPDGIIVVDRDNIPNAATLAEAKRRACDHDWKVLDFGHLRACKKCRRTEGDLDGKGFVEMTAEAYYSTPDPSREGGE